ncbi:MAG: CPBP family intramembrane glutamic endopeptidase [Verrucomicrobiota bacterium]
MAKRDLLFWLGPLIFTVGFLLLAALLAPVFHWAVEPIDENPFRRYTDRALMVAAVLCLLPYLIRHWSGLGWWGQPPAGRALVLGVAVALSGTLLINFLLIGFGWRELIPDELWSALPKALMAAVLVSLIEEILFRGVMLKALSERAGRIAGFWLTAFLFAWVHFLKAPESFQPDPVTWTSGFTSVALALANLPTVDFLPGGRFFTLLLVGVLLGVAKLRTGGLWLPMGLHAGFILGIQWSSRATDLTPAGREAWLGADLLTGPWTWAALVVMILLTWRSPLPGQSPPPAAGSKA